MSLDKFGTLDMGYLNCIFWPKAMSGVLRSRKESNGRRGGTRTLKALRPQDFKSCVYTIPPLALNKLVHSYNYRFPECSKGQRFRLTGCSFGTKIIKK